MHDYLSRIDTLKQRGTDVGEALARGAAGAPAEAAVWQRECGALVNPLSGGSKAHWLARAYSGAFLLQSSRDQLLVEAAPAAIVDRLIDVLDQARTALTSVGSTAGRDETIAGRRFDFVRDLELRPVLSRAYADSRRAFEEKQFAVSLITACSIL